jgi:hypothetical protein
MRGVLIILNLNLVMHKSYHVLLIVFIVKIWGKDRFETQLFQDRLDTIKYIKIYKTQFLIYKNMQSRA